jgi:hypothetical protein
MLDMICITMPPFRPIGAVNSLHTHPPSIAARGVDDFLTRVVRRDGAVEISCGWMLTLTPNDDAFDAWAVAAVSKFER